MPADFDQHGFPVPRKFNEDRPRGESQPQPETSSFRYRLVRWAFGLLLVGVVISIIAESPIGDHLRDMAAKGFVDTAESKYNAQDVPGALADLDKAISLAHNDQLRAGIFLVRANWRLEARDLDGALSDANESIAIDSRWARSYMIRSAIQQRLGKHREAIDDMNLAVLNRSALDPDPYNGRAYARALANLELDEALNDIEHAIKLAQVEKSHYLDTRGYIHLLQGDAQAALEDLDRAVKVGEEEMANELEMLASSGAAPALIDRAKRMWNEALAVMHHHRGETHEKLGHKEEAKSDLRRGDELGYNPAAGVY